MKLIRVMSFFGVFFGAINLLPSFLMGTPNASLNQAYGQVAVKDPFVPLLPQPKSNDADTISSPESEALPELKVNVQGALWDSPQPMAIIDGDVYKEGDLFLGGEAKLYRVEQNTVFILYKGIMYERKVGENKEEK